RIDEPAPAAVQLSVPAPALRSGQHLRPGGLDGQCGADLPGSGRLQPDHQAPSPQADGQPGLHVALLPADLADPGHYHGQPGHRRQAKMDVRPPVDLSVHFGAGPNAPARGAAQAAALRPHGTACAPLRHGEAMRFLLIAGFPDSILQFRGALLDALQAQGLDVHVAAPGLDSRSAMHQALRARGMTAHDIPLQRTGMNPAKDLRSLLSLWRLMRRLRPHYTLAYTIKPVIYGTLAGWLAGVPQRYALITGLGYAFQGDDQAKDRRGTLRNVAKTLYRQGLKKAHKAFFQNPDDEALFRGLKILHPGQSTHVVNGSGVDLDRYQVAPLPKAPHFLLIARLLGDKGVREYA